MSNNRGDVYEFWVNSYGLGFILFLVFAGLWLAAFVGWL